MTTLRDFEQAGMHRLIPAAFADESVLESLSLPSEVISALTELDAATNERKVAERAGNAAIGPGELLYGVPEAHIVNAAFTHPGLFGGRFNDARRGAWYAAVDVGTSVREVGYHKRMFLKDARIGERLSFDYQDFLADFSGQFHSLDDLEREQCLQPHPVPQCYAASQTLANALLYSGANGIVYPSVRHEGGTCIACFRPALVFHPRRGKGYAISVAAGEEKIETAVVAVRGKRERGKKGKRAG